MIGISEVTMFTIFIAHIILFLISLVVWAYTDQDSTFGECMTMTTCTLLMSFILYYPAILTTIVIKAII
jgi:isoprenylcysteine carboxyl methyltransferase (ICMT) family protein YpbQ